MTEGKHWLPTRGALMGKSSAKSWNDEKFETRQRRIERSMGMRRLRELEAISHALWIMMGARTPGRTPDKA